MPWLRCSGELKEHLEWLWDTQPRAFQKIYQSLPRPYPDPQLECHLQIYQQCSILQYKLDRLNNTPLLSDELLKTLKVIRGAPFDIDDCHSLDIEKRFFTATRDELASQYAQDFLNRGGKWPKVERKYPLFKNGKPILDLSSMHNYAPVLWEMTAWEGGHESNPWWFRNGLTSLDPMLLTTFGKIVRGSRNPFHDFQATYTLLYKGGNSQDPNPTFPHTIVVTCDTLTPDDRILRSELLLAVSIVRRTHATNPCLEHHTLPILVLSFHETGGRILQLHTENDHLVVRVSRRLKFPTDDGSIPADALTMLRWMLAAPMGDTRLPFKTIVASTKADQVSRNEEDPKLPSSLRIPAVVEPDPLISSSGCPIEC